MRSVWEWEDLSKHETWYTNIVLPAVQAHRAKQHQAKSVDLSQISKDGIIISTETTFPRFALAASGSYRSRSTYFDSIVSDDEVGLFDFPSDSEDSYERVCNENWTGESMKTFEKILIPPSHGTGGGPEAWLSRSGPTK